jgi:large subunit ribosomal protein L32
VPNPKRRHSKSRTSKRRTHDTLVNVQSGRCSQCQEMKLPHQVCKNCGFYNGRQVRAVKED